MRIAIKNVQIIDQESAFNEKKVDVFIEDGIVKKIGNIPSDTDYTIEGEGLKISKGWCDLRVHLKDPGFEHQQTLEQTLTSAAKGGFTSILTMPDTDPLIAGKSLVKSLINRSADEVVDILPSGILTKNREGEELAELLDMCHAGAFAFTDGDHPDLKSEVLGLALMYLKDYDRPILIHAEDYELSQNGQMNEGEMSTRLGMKGIPHLAEYSRVKRDLDLLEHYGGRLHFSHISTPESLDLIRKAKKAGLQVSCDMAAHHLILSDGLLHDYDSNYKVHPPLREASVIKKFWKAIEDGTVDAIVSDHNPKDEESKNLEFDLADHGILGLETLFPALFTFGKNKISLNQMIDKLTAGPDRILGRKREAIAEGVAADFTLFSTDSPWQYNIADGEAFNSPFDGDTFEARIVAVINKEYVFINK